MLDDSQYQTQTKNWNEQLAEWYRSSGMKLSQIKARAGIPDSTLYDLIHGRTRDLKKVSPERRKALYELTGLECFKDEGIVQGGTAGVIEIGEPRKVGEIEIIKDVGKAGAGSTGTETKERAYTARPPVVEAEAESRVGVADVVKKGIEGIERIVSEATAGLSGSEKLRAGLLKFQLYRKTAGERADVIMELLNVLSEEVDYFRTASREERRVLVERLKRDPDSFGYVTQMLNVLYKGEKIDSWMLMAQPPSKIGRVVGNK